MGSRAEGVFLSQVTRLLLIKVVPHLVARRRTLPTYFTNMPWGHEKTDTLTALYFTLSTRSPLALAATHGALSDWHFSTFAQGQRPRRECDTDARVPP